MKTSTVTVEQMDEEYDVVVAGGGLSGVCAAIAAAREGAKAILLEAGSALGGMATLGLVPAWCGVHNGQDIIHSSLSQTVMRASWPDSAQYDYIKRVPFIDAELLKRECDALVTQAGVDVLFHTTVAGVSKKGDQIGTVYLANKNGITALAGSVFIDCTGDADLAAWAGAGYDKGDPTGELQPATHCFAISNINGELAAEELKQHPNWADEIMDDPEYPLIQDTYFGLGNEVGSSLRVLNSGHLWNVDNTDPRNQTQALLNGRKLTHQLFRAYKKYMPKAMQNASLAYTAPLMGVRETRRIHGQYQLVRADYDARRRFDDEIAFCCFLIDIHPSLELRRLERKGLYDWRKEMNDSRYRTGEFFGIPYRCLQPKGISNLLVAGRSISSDREVNGALRIMPTCMSMGEAAGIAAGLAATEHNGEVGRCNPVVIQNKIRNHGGFMPAK